VKILILGESGVGKSSILHRFIEDKFNPSFSTTLGVDYKQKEIRVEGNERVMV
jgi:GTPase SAR1 family protein